MENKKIDMIALILAVVALILAVISMAVIPGPEGPAGPEGPQGQQGLKGDTGDTGPQGDQGSTGPQGAQGAQGAQGPQGLQGLQGSQGIQGIPGTGSQIFTNYSVNVSALPTSCGQIGGLQVTLPSGVESGSYVWVTATVVVKIDHASGSDDLIEMYISDAVTCDDYPGNMTHLLPGGPASGVHYYTYTFQRVFYYSSAITAPVDFYVTGMLSLGVLGGDEFHSGNIVAIYFK
jgi:hypothetical protein